MEIDLTNIWNCGIMAISEVVMHCSDLTRVARKLPAGPIRSCGNDPRLQLV